MLSFSVSISRAFLCTRKQNYAAGGTENIAQWNNINNLIAISK